MNIVGKSPGAFSKKIRYSLLALDAKTGKEKFEVDIKDDEYTTILMNGNINPETGNILLFGEYYPIDARPMKDPSLGLFSYTMDMEGNIIDKKYTSWVDDVSKFVEVNEKGKEKGKGFTFFHKIIQAKDGRIFAIGEQFRKSVSEVGVALAVLGGSNSNVALLKMVIDDMVIYEFSPEFELKNVRVIEKDKTDINLPQGMGIVNSQVLARYIESLGMFDYSFTQMRDEGENFTIVYIDYKRLKGEKDKFMLEALSYEGGEFVEDAIDLTPEKKSTSRTVFPGKPGYIVVSEYFRKDKTIVSRLEKINF